MREPVIPAGAREKAAHLAIVRGCTLLFPDVRLPPSTRATRRAGSPGLRCGTWCIAFVAR